MMERIKYRIQSKLKRADGTPDFVMFGTTANIEQTIKFHQFHLSLRTHPNPQLMNYSDRHGWNCFEYIIDPQELKIIETATIEPRQKEVRKRKQP
jgi:hypothetical protein